MVLKKAFWEAAQSPLVGLHYLDGFVKKTWTHTLTFAVPEGVGPLYLALVAHPVDADSSARAAAFLNDAISRPRSLHHAQAMMALMLACEGTTPVKWLDWLETLANRSVDEHIRESDPEQIDIITKYLRGRAEQVRIESAAALAVLSGLQRVGPLLENIKMEPEKTVPTFIEFCKTRSIDTKAAPRFAEIRDSIPAVDQATFEVALHYAQPDALVSTALAKWADKATPMDTRIEYGMAALNVVVSQGKQHPESERLAREAGNVLATAKGVSDKRMMDMATALHRFDKPSLYPALLTRAENKNYQPTDPWEVGWWEVIQKDSEKGLPYVKDRMEQLIAAAYSTGLRRSPLRPILLAIVEHYGKAWGDGPWDLKILFHKTKEDIEIHPDTVYGRMLHLCSSKVPRDLDRLTVMLDAGWDVNRVPSRFDPSLLYSACERGGNIPAIKLLIQRGADVNLRSKGAKLPLHSAMQNGSMETVKTLLDAGAKFTFAAKPSAQELAPWLMLAGTYRGLPGVKLMIEQGADIHSVAAEIEGTDSIRSLMDVALRAENADLIAFCREHGIKPRRFHDRLYDELRVAIHSNNIGEIDRIAGLGFDLNTKETPGPIVNTSLQTAATVATFERLFHHGMRINIDAYRFAESQGRTPFVELFKKESAKVSKDAKSDPIQVYHAIKDDLPTLKKNGSTPISGNRNDNGSPFVSWFLPRGPITMGGCRCQESSVLHCWADGKGTRSGRLSGLRPV